MGILDGYQFDPQTYGGSGGILAQLAQQFGLPNQANVQPNFPTMKGDYLNQPDPRYGQGVDMLRGLMQPQTQLPPTSTPTSGVTLPQQDMSGFGRDAGQGGPLDFIRNLLPGGGGSSGGPYASAAPGAGQQQGGPPPPAAAGPGLLDRLSAGANSFQGGNPIAALINGVQGLATGQRNDPMGILQQQQAATYQALVQAGVPPGAAQAAALNPEVLKTIAPQLYSKPDFGVIGTDQYGNLVHGFINKTSQQVTPVTAAGGAAGALGGGPGVPGSAMDLHGDDYLKTLDPAKANLVKRTAEGTSPYPSGFVMKTPFGQWLTQAVGQYEPGVDANTFAARGTMLKDAAKTTPGSLGGQITFSGTAINHLADVAKRAEELGNWNGLGSADLAHFANFVRGRTTEQAHKISNLEGATQHYGQEVTKFYAGSPGGESERQRFMTSIGAAKSNEELIGAIQAERDLIPGRIAELRNRIESTLGASAPKLTKQLDQAERGLAEIDATLAKMRGIPAEQKSLAPIDKQALDWANANPKDPRAAQIKQRLGVQ